MKKVFTSIFILLNLLAYSQTISTYAGSGLIGLQNGPADLAQFFGVEQMAVDNDGNVYIADSENNVIRKISPEGMASTYAGTGIAGDVDGTSTSAQFDFPLGVAVGNLNEVYVADNGNQKIKVIQPDGQVETIAGDGIEGFQDGALSAARFNRPVYLCVDKIGNIYVGDNLNHRIRKIDLETEMVSTIAGDGDEGFLDGPADEARFSLPRGVAVDEDLNVYVGDQGNNAIRKISVDGVVTTIAGDGIPGYMDGEGSAARFNGPKGIVLDSLGNIYVADRLNFVVRKIDASNTVSTIAGIAGTSGNIDGEFGEALIGRAVAVAMLNNQCLLVSDWENTTIRKVQFNETVSTNAPFALNAFDAFPNPAKDYVQIEGEFGDDFEVFLLDVNGRTILQEKDVYLLPLNQFAEGVYFLKIIGEHFYGIRKIIK